MAIECLFVIATLLSGSLTGILSYIVTVTRRHPKHCTISHTFPLHCYTAAQDDYISNFKVVNQNSTHITFSWDIVDGYYNSSYIRYFYIHYQHRSSVYQRSLFISYSSTTRNGATFRYTSSVGNFNNGLYIMWLQAYRSSEVQPRYPSSRRKYVNIGK